MHREVKKYIVAAILFLSGAVPTAFAIDGYKDSGLPCGQATGPVLCDLNFSQPGLGIIVKIPTDVFPDFPKNPQDLIPGWIGAASDELTSPGGLTRFFPNFYGAALYGPLRDAIANTCVGGSLITQPQTDYFWGKGIHLQNVVCSTFPFCDRFWVNRGAEPGPGTVHSLADSPEEWGIDRGDPEAYGVRLSASSFGPTSVNACAPLAAGVKLTVSAEQIPERGNYTVTWNSGGNPGVTCALTGKMPKSFSANSTSGTNTFFSVPLGVYTHTFTCTGVLDGNRSSKIGTVTKTIIVKAGDIPPPPVSRSRTVI